MVYRCGDEAENQLEDAEEYDLEFGDEEYDLGEDWEEWDKNEEDETTEK